MRKSFDGLCGLVRNVMGQDPMSGDVFIFIGTRKDAINLLHWEQGGFVLYCKRLEEGTFDLPQSGSNSPSKPVSRLSNAVPIFQSVQSPDVGNVPKSASKKCQG
jgi:hypothetical protein